MKEENKVVQLFKDASVMITDEEQKQYVGMVNELKALILDPQYQNFKLMEENIRLKLEMFDMKIVEKYKGEHEAAYIDIDSKKVITGTREEMQRAKAEYKAYLGAKLGKPNN